MSGSIHSAAQNVLAHTFILPSLSSAKWRIKRRVIKTERGSDGSRHERAETTENQEKNSWTISTARLWTDIWIWDLSKYEIGVLTGLMEVFLAENEQTRDWNKGTLGCSVRENKVTIKERDVHRLTHFSAQGSYGNLLRIGMLHYLLSTHLNRHNKQHSWKPTSITQ